MAASPPRSPPRRQSIIELSRATGPDPVRILLHAACTDSYHDFHKSKGFSDKLKGDTANPGVFDARMGLYIPDGTRYTPLPLNRDHKTGGKPNPDALHDEDELMVEVFRNVAAPGQRFSDELNIVQALIAYLQGTPTGELSDQRFDGLWDLQPDGSYMVQSHSYNIKLFKSGGTDNIKKLWLPTKPPKPDSRAKSADITDFFGGDKIHLLFDASVLDLMTFIKSTSGGGGPIAVHRIFNREVVNDPATKTYEDKPISPLVTSDVYFDYNKEIISYKRHGAIEIGADGIGYIPNSAVFQRDKLFSQYDFNLGPLVYQKSGAPRINLELYDASRTRVHASNDPHEDNNIAKCWKRVLESYKKSSKHINSAAHLHCKRSGDWLQALSCLDTARLYNNADITVGAARGDGQLKLVNGENLILVTHDRVLLTYALTLGIDVILTYKWSESGAAGVVEEAVDAGEEEGGVEDESTRHILYFRNSKNDTPEKKLDVILKGINSADYQVKTETGTSVASKIATYITNYNTWVQMIETSAKNTIEMAVAACDTAKNLVDLGKNGVSKLLQAYIRYTSIDYTKLNADEFNETLLIYGEERARHAENIVKANTEAGITEQLAALKNLAMQAGILRALVGNLFDRRTRIGNLEALVAANSAYKSNPMYVSPLTLTSIYNTRTKGSGESGPLNTVLETVSYLSQRLPYDMYAEAIVHFDRIRTKHANMFIADKAYLYDLFLPSFRNAAPTRVTAAVLAQQAAPLTQKVIAEVTACIEEEVEVYAELADKVPDAPPAAVADDDDEEPVTACDDQLSKPLTAEEAADETAQDAIDAAPPAAEVEPLPPSSSRIRKIATVFGSIGIAVKRFGLSMFPSLGARQGGGATGVNNRNNMIKAELLVKLYLRELYMSLEAYESEGNFDYDYYKTIATISTSVSKLHPANWVKQQAFFYDELPNMDFKDIYPKDSQAYLRYNLNLAVTTLALNSIDMAIGPIPSMGFTGIGSIPLAETLAYNKVIRRLPFEEQRDTLIAAVKAAILVSTPTTATLARNREARNRTRKAAAPVQVPVNRRMIGHVLGDGSRPSDVVQNDWLVRASAQRDAVAAARAAEHARWVAEAQQAPAAPGRYGAQEGLRIRGPRGGDKRTKRRPRKSSKRGRTYKSRNTRRLSRRSDR